MTKPVTIPTYRGHDHVGGAFPTEAEAWPKFKTRQTVDASGDFYDVASEEVREYADTRPWTWPGNTIFFLCDQHADAEAFFRSLVACGGVSKTGAADTDFELTDEGKHAMFVIGGDCLDKGPNNLRLLRALRMLMDKGAHVQILAGNHDVRALVGLVYLGRKEPWLAHLFIRMGQKSIPLFREVYDEYLMDRDTSGDEAEEERLREVLFPPASWYDEFPQAVTSLLPEKMIRKEVARIREKVDEFETRRAAQGMSLAMILAAAQKVRDLFLDPQSEFAFYFRHMQLLLHQGSFLFVHAGIDDVVAKALERDGAEALNERFRHLMQENLFELYNGPIGNAFRTKYRDSDFRLTQDGVDAMHRAGVQAIIHGHRNIPRGQRQVLRSGILNFECDASVDQNTRKRLGLVGVGGAVTIVRPQGSVTGISTDYPYAKHFDATVVLDRKQLRLVEAEIELEAKGNGGELMENQNGGAAVKGDKDKEKSEVKFENTMPLDEAVSYFEAIVAGLKKGSISLKRGERNVTLTPATHVEVEVKAVSKKKREGITFEIVWKTPEPSELTISSK